MPHHQIALLLHLVIVAFFMAKDPAFLFYSSDFLTGTSFLTNEQIGMYIKLLCLQHQSGRLKEKDMMKICGRYDEDIFDKFTKDSDGQYYNVRLDEEMNKRQAYSESRRQNRKKKDMLNISDTYDKHMENVNVNVNVNTVELIVYSEEYLKFNEWLKNNAPSVLKLKEPITEDQYLKLKEYDRKLVADTLVAMHNKKDLTKKYTSAYLTLINWLKRNNIENGKSRIDSNIDIAKQYIEQSRSNGI